MCNGQLKVAKEPGRTEPVASPALNPITQRLGSLIDASLEWSLQSHRGLHVTRPGCLSSDFKFNLRDLFEEPPDENECRRVAKALVHLAVASDIEVRWPSIFLRLTDDFIYDSAVDRILADGTSYGTNTLGCNTRILLSFSNPNLNKPLHVGHLRGNCLGGALARIHEACGSEVLRAQVASDWGRHICQAIVGYLRWGDGATPETTDIKGDHFVGQFYERFHAENATLGHGEGVSDVDVDVDELLIAMERNDPAALALNQMITAWAQSGIGETYQRIGTRFDVVFREAGTLERSRGVIRHGLATGILRSRSDGSIYAELSGYGLGEVTLVRSDGTLVAYAQLLGSYVERYELTKFDRTVVVNGDQWTFGFGVIDTLLQILGYEWAWSIDRVYHGMVSLPEGRMASRMGRVVYADAILDEIAAEIPRRLRERGIEWGGTVDTELAAQAVLKLSLLRVARERPLRFDRNMLWSRGFESFVLLLHLLGQMPGSTAKLSRQSATNDTMAARRRIAMSLSEFPTVVARAAAYNDPSHVARFIQETCAYVAGADVLFDERLTAALRIVLGDALHLLNITLSVRGDAGFQGAGRLS